MPRPVRCKAGKTCTSEVALTCRLLSQFFGPLLIWPQNHKFEDRAKIKLKKMCEKKHSMKSCCVIPKSKSDKLMAAAHCYSPKSFLKAKNSEIRRLQRPGRNRDSQLAFLLQCYNHPSERKMYHLLLILMKDL